MGRPEGFLANAGAEVAKVNLGARFNEAAACRDLAERKEKGEVFPAAPSAMRRRMLNGQCVLGSFS